MRKQKIQADNSQDSEKECVRIKGLLSRSGVAVSAGSESQNLASRGYGTKENDKIALTFYEALYLQSKEMLDVVNGRTDNTLDFQELLHEFQLEDENVWERYLIYRDLRSRGYVVREGFGLGITFRVYERGEYGKSTATYLVLGIQEGKPATTKKLARVLKHVQSLKKKLVLAVVNRRGEIVYYTVSKLTMK